MREETSLTVPRRIPGVLLHPTRTAAAAITTSVRLNMAGRLDALDHPHAASTALSASSAPKPIGNSGPSHPVLVSPVTNGS